jgi:dTDP-4-amino-4,6-dideoxygalactose transaminase
LSGPADLVLPKERPGAQYNYHLFPVLLRNREERAAMMSTMWARFVDTSMIYSGVVREARQFGYEGGCPVGESVADSLLTLPNYAGLTAEEIDYVAEIFLSSLSLSRTLGIQPAPDGQRTPEAVRI